MRDATRAGWTALLGYTPLATLLGSTFLLGFAGVGTAVRPMFVLGCAVVSYRAWQRSAAYHLQIAIALFCLTPFLRRIVDSSAGYDPAGLMLIGPFLAILIPTIELRDLFRPDRRFDPALRPFILVGACAGYGALISLVQGDMMGTASGALKWAAPLLYGVWLYERARTDANLVPAAVQAFLVLMPVIGAYGVFQYVDPPAWDRYWMLYAPIISIGLPEAYQVRVFSTMNSPASFAVFIACGLLLVGFCRSGWGAALLAVPCTLGLLLSLYRTAWIALVTGVLFCLLFRATRRRAAVLAIGGVIAVVLAAVLTPFGDVIEDRIGTLGQGGEDGSAQERIQEFVTLLNTDGGTLLGHGFGGSNDAGQAGVMPIDGQIVACWYFMGLVVGLLCIAGIIWAAWQAMMRTVGNRDPERVVLGAIMAGALVQLPLGGVASNEAGFLFWAFAAIATAGVPNVDVSAKAREHNAMIGWQNTARGRQA